MYKDKHVLLIGGGGTLGLYTAQNLLEKGCRVDVLCMNDPEVCHENLQIIQQAVDYGFLETFLAEKHYNGIVNFLHYDDVEDYKPVHELLCAHTDHLIFLSSYRVYGGQTPITEETPTLLHSSTDEEFLKNKHYYALVKMLCEDYMRNESGTDNWTAVRPVISFSSERLDIVTRSRQLVWKYAKEGKAFELPEEAKNLTAALDWAGNSGKLIANLLFKPETFGQSYTVSSAQNLTWGQVADIYAELLGVQIQWVDTQYYLERYHQKEPYILLYDRLFDRTIDNSKVLAATGLAKENFTPIREGIKMELRKLGWREENA